jgi:methylphosphotriester-DNA--protein-cysteine methyltransferase
MPTVKKAKRENVRIFHDDAEMIAIAAERGN